MTKHAMHIRPIRNEEDHSAAVARIEQIISAAPGTPEGDELDVLATLAHAYEAAHHPIDPPDPISAIRFRMEQQNLSRKALEPMIGSRARVSEVLTGKRPLTLQMIRRISVGLGIPADVLIAAVPAKRAPKPRQRTAVSAARASGKQARRAA